jgi:hypothetical protein
MPLRMKRPTVDLETGTKSVRLQAQEEPSWFAFRTDVSLRGAPLARPSLVWLVLLVVLCSACVALFGALVWLVSLDLLPLGGTVEWERAAAAIVAR